MNLTTKGWRDTFQQHLWTDEQVESITGIESKDHIHYWPRLLHEWRLLQNIGSLWGWKMSYDGALMEHVLWKPQRICPRTGERRNSWGWKKIDSFLARNRICDENLAQFVTCLEIQFLDHMSSLNLLQKVTIRAPKNKHKKLAPLDSDCDRYRLFSRRFKNLLFL